MRKLFILLLMAVTAITATAQTIGEAFYIYRNDGQFNAFFRDEVDSIAYSHYDADSVYYNENVTQLVYTADSLYLIPLAAIDSIGFVQPETKYKEEAVPLTGQLFDYLIKADSLTLIFASTTPSALLPKIGDKLVATDLTDKLPIGFTGIVRQVQEDAGRYEVICDSLDLDEVVDQLYAVVEIVGSQADGNVRRYLPRRAKSEQIQSFHLVIPSISQKLSLTPLLKPKDMYSLNGKAVAQTTANPVITGKITYVKDKLLKLDQYNIHIILDVPTITKVEAVGQATNSNDSLSLLSNKTSLAIQGTRPGPYGIPIYYAFGPKFDLSGELALGTTVYADFAQTMNINFYPATVTIGAAIPGVYMINTVDVSSPRLTHFDVDWTYIAGRVSARCAVVGRLGIGIAAKGKNLGWFGAELKLGAKAEAELGFDFEAMSNAEKGTGFYDGLKSKSKVVVMPFCGLEGKVSVVNDRFQFTFIGRDDIPLPGKLQWDFLPIFSDTKAVSNGTSATTSANITNDCILPDTVGFSLFDGNNNRIGEPQWNEQKFHTRNGFSLPLKTTFTNLATDKKYKVYPSLKLFGFTVLASPSADLDMHFPVTLSDFKVTDKQHKEKGFTHEGRQYDYRFDVSVTATLDEEATGIADWGYMYQDPFGNPPAKISLKDYGTTYTDTRWAYFRNEAKSTCTLYGYVEYMGSNEPVYGEPKTYTLEYKSTELKLANLNVSDVYFTYNNSTPAIIGVVNGAVVAENAGDASILSSLYQYGVYYRTNDGNPYLISTKNYESFTVSVGVERDYLDLNFNSFIAKPNMKLSFGAWACDEDGNVTLYDEQNVDIIYDTKPSIAFTSVAIEDLNSYYVEPTENTQGYMMYEVTFTYRYVVNGALWIENVNHCGATGETFNYTGYIEDAEYQHGLVYSYNLRGFTEGQYIYLTMTLVDGSTIMGSNSIVFGGSPESPTVSIGGPVSGSRRQLTEAVNSGIGISHILMYENIKKPLMEKGKPLESKDVIWLKND